MKKAKSYIIFSLMFIIVFLSTACNYSKGIEDYKKAVIKTDSIEKGTIIIEANMDIEFEKAGLSQDEIKELSYFDNIIFLMDQQYDYSNKDNHKIISKNYYNFGGMGFDSIFYMNGTESFIEIPIVGQYVKIDTKDFVIEEDNLPEENYMVDFISEWNKVLNKEDVITGKKAYIITDEGQIKTTTYSINITTEQIKVLLDKLLVSLEKEQIVDEIIKMQEDINVNKVEILNEMKEFISKIKVEGFKGKAYVDFDGRLVKHEFSTVINMIDPKVKEPKKISIRFEISHTNLGKEQEFDFPVINDDDIIEVNEQMNFEEILPESFIN